MEVQQFSHQRGTSGIAILVDVDESEEGRILSRGSGISGDADRQEGWKETRTLSHGRDMSEASDKRDTSTGLWSVVPLLTSN